MEILFIQLMMYKSKFWEIDPYGCGIVLQGHI